MLIERYIKESLRGKDEKIKVKLNISYFEADESVFPPNKNKEFNNYYKNYSQAFYNFADRVLLPKADKAKSLADNTSPYGAVMKCMNSFFGEKLICIVTDAFLYIDGTKTENKRISHFWSRESGKPFSAKELFNNNAEKKIDEYLLANGLDKGSKKCCVFISSKGYGFSSNDNKTVILPYGQLPEIEKISIF